MQLYHSFSKKKAERDLSSCLSIEKDRMGEGVCVCVCVIVWCAGLVCNDTPVMLEVFTHSQGRNQQMLLLAMLCVLKGHTFNLHGLQGTFGGKGRLLFLFGERPELEVILPYSHTERLPAPTCPFRTYCIRRLSSP